MKNCKKLLAFILSMLLVFTMALNPVVTVAAISEKTEIVEVEAEVGGFFDSVINWIVDGIHNLVGGFLSIFDEECPFCDKVHGEDIDDKSSADEYFENNARLIDTMEVDKSKDVMTESEVKAFLAEKGFDGYPITYSHSINGDYVDETKVLEDSEDKHPMYQTIYVSASEESWVIYVINGEIFANPIDFNLESDLGVELLISESEMLTSYDDETNKFYITIPFDSACLTIPVEKIDAETLDELTVEKICDLSGATISTSENVDSDTLDIDSISTYSFDESFNSFSTYTTNNVSVEDPFIVVSLGDSYSSGEGIEPFYGQDKSLSEKVKDQDWLAHRSKKSWPSLLSVPGVTGSKTMSEFRVATGSSSSANIQWYFGAVSGAETKHFNKNKQKKEYLQYYKDGITTIKHSMSGVEYLPKQLDIFDSITSNVDYVTLTVGGNDVGFADIVTTCATNCAYLYFGYSSKLEDTFTDLWAEFDTTKTNIKKVYEDIRDAAGPQAAIIVAGYPKLLNKDGKGAVINKREATLVNDEVSAFNDEIEKIVNECRASGMNIHFVDVEPEFGGHEAYSSDAWINKIMIGSQSQDIKHDELASAYSIHPNEEGAKAYARCVNAKIAELEMGILSVRICKASDRITPVADAKIQITGGDYASLNSTSDDNGDYSTLLPVGTYQVRVTADDYIDFVANVSIEKNKTERVEVFLTSEDEVELPMTKREVLDLHNYAVSKARNDIPAYRYRTDFEGVCADLSGSLVDGLPQSTIDEVTQDLLLNDSFKNKFEQGSSQGRDALPLTDQIDPSYYKDITYKVIENGNYQIDLFLHDEEFDAVAILDDREDEIKAILGVYGDELRFVGEAEIKSFSVSCEINPETGELISYIWSCYISYEITANVVGSTDVWEESVVEKIETEWSNFIY